MCGVILCTTLRHTTFFHLPINFLVIFPTTPHIVCKYNCLHSCFNLKSMIMNFTQNEKYHPYLGCKCVLHVMLIRIQLKRVVPKHGTYLTHCQCLIICCCYLLLLMLAQSIQRPNLSIFIMEETEDVKAARLGRLAWIDNRV